jgi:hypothetical protein
MESFVDVAIPHGNALLVTDRPVTQIALKEGETRILALPKPSWVDLAASHSFYVTTSNPSVAPCSIVRKLTEEKVKYLDNYDFGSVMSRTIPEVLTVGRRKFLLVQISGKRPGACQLSAGGLFLERAYAQPVSITVIEDKKLFTLPPGGVSFRQLWANHPYNPQRPAYKDPLASDFDYCDKQISMDPKDREVCMTRFCMALKHSGVDLGGLRGKKTCMGTPPQPIAAKHAHHFVNPYDFELWQGVRQAYVYQRSSAQPEPMPGLAALDFMQGRTGIVMFKNFAHKDMQGGHIDLWDGDKMGNELGGGQQKTFFLRSERIDFWPLP